MAWDSKMPPFDLSELEQNATDPGGGIGSVVRPGGVLGRQLSGLDCSVDLKLGGFGEFGSPADRWKEPPRAPPPVAAASPSGPSKRARAPSNGSQAAACLVEGCKADLSKCRDYHRRHKVCSEHSKAQVVIVGGQQQRFCQQCSRFHLLVEFDEVKRSCRKRLDGHNRRRRKPQPDPMNCGNLFANHQVSRFTSYPQIFPTTAPDTSWSGIVKTEEDALFTHHQPLHFINRQQTFPVSFSHSLKEGKQFPFLHDDDTTLSTRAAIQASVCQPLLKTFSPSESSSTKMFSEGITQSTLNSDCALSLLSSPAQTAAINLGQMVAPDRIPMGQPLVSSVEYGALNRYARSQTSSHSVSPTGFSCSGIEDEHVGTVLVSTTGDADLHCQGLFQVGGEGSSDGTSQSIPFSWQ